MIFINATVFSVDLSKRARFTNVACIPWFLTHNTHPVIDATPNAVAGYYVYFNPIYKQTMVDSTVLTTLEAIVTTTGVLAGLLLVVLASPLDSVRHRRDELLKDASMIRERLRIRVEYGDRYQDLLGSEGRGAPLPELIGKQVW